MGKIKTKLIEPVQIFTGSIFKIKIKAIKYITYEEVKRKTYDELKNYSYNNLRGD